jgi:hypothetical protein
VSDGLKATSVLLSVLAHVLREPTQGTTVRRVASAT